MTTLACPTGIWEELSASLAEPRETAAFILAGQGRSPEGLTLLARSIHWIPDDEYLMREPHRLEIPSSAFVPILKRAAEDDSIAVFFHTHPGAAPAPSPYDLGVDEVLRGTAQLRTAQEIYASLILGGTPGTERVSGRVFIGDEGGPIDRLRLVGGAIQIIQTEGAGTEGSDSAESETFDRQIRAFGSAGQKTLKDLHVGIAGAGGTGSSVFELLTRLGVGRITIVDDDLVSDSNLTRIHESGHAQVGESKVQVAAAAAERIGLGTSVKSLQGRISELELAKELRHCDVIFGCTDDNTGRAVLSRIAYWYLVPVIDTAFLVDSESGSIRGLFGRLTIVEPGRPCLFCRGRIDQAELMAEGLDSDERERLAGEGYVPGLGEPDPSVGAYTSLVGASAVTELLDRLFAISGNAAPGELLLRVHARSINTIDGVAQAGHYCHERSVWGRGDEEPFLGQLWPQSDAD